MVWRTIRTGTYRQAEQPKLERVSVRYTFLRT